MLDASKFKQLFIPHHRRLYLLALRLLGDSQEAQDAVQDLYIRLWEKRDSIVITDNPEGFLTMSMRNFCISRLRTRRTTVALEHASDRSFDDDVEAGIDSRDRVAYLLRFIDTLPPAQRQALTMRDIDGCEMSEVEATLNVSTANARTILSRARTALRKHFQNREL